MQLQTLPSSYRRPSPGVLPARSVLKFTMADASESETTGPVDTLSVVLKNDECGCACLHEAVDAFTKWNAFCEEERFALQLCLEEAVMNIVRYGFDDVDEHEIRVQLRFQADTRVLVVWIVDGGKMLNSNCRNSPQELDQFINDQSSGKLGFYLVRKYTKHVSYCRISGCNHLILSKRIPEQLEGLVVELAA